MSFLRDLCLAVSTILLASTAMAEEVDFHTEVLPVLTRAGCNAGACHGAAAGRGGMQLSLYGSNPAHDHEQLVHRLSGRRVNLADPASSLMLLKPTGLLDHGGGVRIEDGSADYRLLLDWIKAGATRKEGRRLLRFRLEAESTVVEKQGDQVSLAAWATFSDGSEANVTRWTVFQPEDVASIELLDSAADSVQLKLLRSGQHVLLARFLDRVLSIQFIVPMAGSDHTRPPTKAESLVDEHLHRMLIQLNLPIADRADRRTLVRRLSLDLTGRLPTNETVQRYVDDQESDAWPRLVDSLLASEPFVEYWTHRLALLLRLRGRPDNSAPAAAYHAWLSRQVRDDVGLDQIARQLVTASGDVENVGPANFYRTVAGPRQQAELFSEVLMGVRMKCANCHDHPLDRWTQDDYHGLAAVFARVSSTGDVRWQESGLVIHPRDGESARQRIPGDSFVEVSTQLDTRQQLADWLVSTENPFFARAMTNRIWKSLMGRGLVEPTDDLRATNPATHPELLARLTDQFVREGYSTKKLLRTIALSEAYRRRSTSPRQLAGDDRFYSHWIARPLSAEVLLDAVSDVTDVAESYDGLEGQWRAVQLVTATTPSRALDILGRCSRTESCEQVEGRTAGGLTRRLHWLNGPLLNRRITSETGRLQRLLTEGVEAEQVLAEFYQLCYSRPMNEREVSYWKQQLAQVEGERQQRELLEDVVWSLLSSSEFLLNH